MNAAAFIANGLTAMNRAAAAPKPAPVSPIEAMQRAEYRLRLHAQLVTDLGDDGSEFLAWADDLRTAIDQARGL